MDLPTEWHEKEALPDTATNQREEQAHAETSTTSTQGNDNTAATLTQCLDNLSPIIGTAKRCFLLHKLTATEKRLPIEQQVKLQKIPETKAWQEPANQKTLDELRKTHGGGRLYGFDVSGLCIFDFDHVLTDSGEFETLQASDWYNLLSLEFDGAFCERSISGHGLHIIAERPQSMGDKELVLYLDDETPKEERKPENQRPKLEVYSRENAGKYFLLTGNCYECEPNAPIASGEKAAAIIEQVQAEIAKQKGESSTAAKQPTTINDAPEYDKARAIAMLDCVSCEQCTYEEWVKVGMILKSIGLNCDVWDQWSAKDPARYKNGECEKKWESFKKSGAGIATLHKLAKTAGGYDEREFKRNWHKAHEPKEPSSPLNGTLNEPIEAEILLLLRRNPDELTYDELSKIAQQYRYDIFGDQIEMDWALTPTKNKAEERRLVNGGVEIRIGEYTRPRVIEWIKNWQRKDAEATAAMKERQKERELQAPTTQADPPAPSKDGSYSTIDGAAGVKLYCMTDYIGQNYFERERGEFADMPKLSTGFENLDRELYSVYPGLYLFGAVPSAGKTSFLLQMFDNFARQGKDVLFFSAEQTAQEITSKSLARIIFNNFGSVGGLTAIELRRNKDQLRQEKIDDAVAEYLKEIAPRFSFLDIIHARGIAGIETAIKAFITNTGKTPAVCIDYLQVLEIDERLPDMERVAEISKHLRHIQSAYNLSLFVVSSFNRSNYFATADFESFKGSGNLEYDADLIFGLQYQIASGWEMNQKELGGTKDTVTKGQKRLVMEKAKKRQPRKMELKCLKNRYGKLFDVGFLYYSAFETFAVDAEYELQKQFEQVTKAEAEFADSVVNSVV